MTGLMNVGNSCFINAAIQCLVHIPELNQVFESLQTDHLFLNEYNDIRKLMLQGHACVHPKRFVSVLQHIANQKNIDFTGQQDLHECLLFMINTMHDLLSYSASIEFQPSENEIDKKCHAMLKQTYSKDFSKLIPLFYGIYISRIHTTVNPEPFFILELPIPKDNASLVDCIQEYSKIEMVEWYNEETKVKGLFEKQLTIWKFPPLLFITLKRFQGLQKNTSMIHIPLFLNLHGNIYELIWVGNHQGSLIGGHYTCSVKKQTWMYIDDNNTMPIQENQVITPKAYCLLFRIKTV